MDLKHLGYFLTLHDRGNFLQASFDLGISQSQLSKVVQGMEKELGVRLVDRSRRTISFTPEGEMFARGALLISSEWQRLKERLKSPGAEKRILHLLSPPVIAAYGLNRLLTTFKEAHPEVFLTIEEREAQEIPPALLSCEADLGVMREMFVDRTVFDYFPWLEDEVVVVVNSSHPLSGEKKVDLGDFSKEKFIFPAPQTLLMNYYTGLCRSSGFQPQVVHTGKHMDDLLSLAASGDGVALMMGAFIKHLRPKGVSVLRFKNPVRSTIGFVYRRDSGGAINSGVKSFLTFAAQRKPVK